MHWNKSICVNAHAGANKINTRYRLNIKYVVYYNYHRIAFYSSIRVISNGKRRGKHCSGSIWLAVNRSFCTEAEIKRPVTTLHNRRNAVLKAASIISIDNNQTNNMLFLSRREKLSRPSGTDALQPMRLKFATPQNIYIYISREQMRRQNDNVMCFIIWAQGMSKINTLQLSRYLLNWYFLCKLRCCCRWA